MKVNIPSRREEEPAKVTVFPVVFHIPCKLLQEQLVQIVNFFPRYGVEGRRQLLSFFNVLVFDLTQQFILGVVVAVKGATVGLGAFANLINCDVIIIFLTAQPNQRFL